MKRVQTIYVAALLVAGTLVTLCSDDVVYGTFVVSAGLVGWLLAIGQRQQALLRATHNVRLTVAVTWDHRDRALLLGPLTLTELATFHRYAGYRTRGAPTELLAARIYGALATREMDPLSGGHLRITLDDTP